MIQMVDRQKARWRIIHNTSSAHCWAYNVEYRIEDGEWQEWGGYDTRLGARFALWRAKRMSKPIGGKMVVYESGTIEPDPCPVCGTDRKHGCGH